MRGFLLGTILIFLPACGGGQGFSGDPAACPETWLGWTCPAPSWRVALRHWEENPSGVAFGFWSNYQRNADALEAFGRRPLDRVDFVKWFMVERTPGIYDFEGRFRDHALAHRCGSSIVANVNVALSREINPEGIQAIPAWYAPRITDPRTRKAARSFLRAYVQALLRGVGDVTLSIDYEFFWFYRPSNGDPDVLRREYRDWYVEAVDLARAAAREIGMEDQLRIIPILNGAPEDLVPYLGSAVPDHVPASWLLDIVAASDALGVDLYDYWPNDPTSPGKAMDVLRFWREHYSLGKPIYVTEVGFSTVAEHVPALAHQGYHARGSEAEQALFLKNLFQSLARDNQPGEPLGDAVRGLSLWSYADHHEDDRPWAHDVENHFGLVRPDGSPKPAFHEVQKAWNAFEGDERTAPSRLADESDVTEMLFDPGAPEVVTRYLSGTRNDSLQVTFEHPPRGFRLWLRVELDQPSALVVRVNEGFASTAEQGLSTSPELDVTDLLRFRGENQLEIFVTDDRFPVIRRVRSLALLATKK